MMPPLGSAALGDAMSLVDRFRSPRFGVLVFIAALPLLKSNTGEREG
jgi:hypothetical protein